MISSSSDFLKIKTLNVLKRLLKIFHLSNMASALKYVGIFPINFQIFPEPLF